MMTPVFAVAQPAFQKKDIFVNAGVALGNYRTYSYIASERSGKALPFFASIEYGFNNQLSVGPFAGFYSMDYKYIGNSAEDASDDFVYHSYYTVVGIRGTHHFTSALENTFKTDLQSDDLDLYISVLLGYELNKLSGMNGLDIPDKSRPVAGVVAGVRYFVNYRFALFAEAGPGILGLAAIGATARF